MAISADELFLKQALELAARGLGLAAPNPLVGAVIVDERGRIVGSGTHLYAERKHAEVLAIEQAGPLARGNTLYLNLEPCSHTGRTAPCADAVIAAGIARVVCCMEDPNPLVAGKGFAKLRAAGIEVEVGLLEAEAKRLNESFAQFIRTGLPFVTLKAAMSLDGKIAGPVEPRLHLVGSASPNPSYITGEAARRRVHEMRHASDAILVGVGTVIADDPLLTDRSGRARRRPLLRVILDSRLRLPLHSRIVQTANNDVLVLCSFAEEKRKLQLQQLGIRVQQIPVGGPEGRPDLAAVARCLGEMEITSVLIEGGAMVNWAALASGIVDKVFLYYAPKILAGTGSVPFAHGEGFARISDAAYVRSIKLCRFGEDFAVEGYLRDPYASI